MSILIRGMEMPKNCGECMFSNTETNSCFLFSQGCVDRYNINLSIKQEWCELVGFPAQHGRLIDADALIIDLMDRGVEGVQTDDWHEIQQAVEDAPTVIEAEEGAK